MTRFPPVPDADLTPDQQRMSARAAKTGPYQAFLRAPRMWEALQAVREYLSRESELSLAAREMAMLVIAAHWRSAAALSAHKILAGKAGIPGTEIERITGGHACSDAVSKEDAIVVDLTRSLLTTGQADDALFAAAQDCLGPRAIVEVAGLIGFFTTICFTLNIAEIEPEQSADTP